MISVDWDSISKMSLSMSAVLMLVVVFLITLLYVWHKESDNRIDLKDLICKDGQLDEKKLTRLGAWIVSTWGFVYYDY